MKIKKTSIFANILTVCAAGSIIMSSCGNVALDKFIELLKKHPEADGEKKVFTNSYTQLKYTLHVHSPAVLAKMEPSYTKQYTTDNLIPLTSPATKIEVTKENGHAFIKAASFSDPNIAASTNYDAVWVRDSVWGYFYLANNADPAAHSNAKEVLLTLLDYMIHQDTRLEADINNPKLVTDDPNGQMNAVHIRFDSKSPEFNDVMVNGKPQDWNHKQNDALGLLIQATVEGLKSGIINLNDLLGNRLLALIKLVSYLNKIEFWKMEDSGAWEEIQRLNTSSVGIVTSAFSELKDYLASEPSFKTAYDDARNTLPYKDSASAETLDTDIGFGQNLINLQLLMGGESPQYSTNDPKYRIADAALLNLIYPASHCGINIEQKEKILNTVYNNLDTEYGIKRYQDDTYQAGNYWFNGLSTNKDSGDSNSDRKKDFIQGSEASWFFDSWFANCALRVAQDESGRQSHKEYYQALANVHINKTLAFITGDNQYVADGKKVDIFALPESYNCIINKNDWYHVASPITPLNWSKASLSLMLSEIIDYYS